MVKTTKLRIFRMKYHITLVELAKLAGISHQYLNYIERGENRPSKAQQKNVANAFGRLIEQRKQALCELSREFNTHKDSLLIPMEVESDEF